MNTEFEFAGIRCWHDGDALIVTLDAE